jgi:hypothetical protein
MGSSSMLLGDCWTHPRTQIDDTTRDSSIDVPTVKDWVVNEMAFPDVEAEGLIGPQAPAPRSAGVNPVSERGEDQARDEVMRELEEQPSCPLSGDEKRAAEADPGRAPTVYAPASQRVSKEPLPGDREIMDHVDSSTTERRAAKHEQK